MAWLLGPVALNWVLVEGLIDPLDEGLSRQVVAWDECR